MDLSEWFAQLLGTLIGTGVGFGLAMWWDRTKEHQRRAEDCSETTKSILLELEGVLNRLETAEAELSQVDDRGAVVVDMSLPFLSVSAFDAAVHSGKLTLLRPEVQEELSTVYEQLRIMRMHVDNAATSYARGSTPQEHGAVIQNATNYLRGFGEMLRPQLLAALESLKTGCAP